MTSSHTFEVIRATVLDGPSLRGLRDALFPAPRGERAGQKRPVRFKLGGYSDADAKAQAIHHRRLGTDTEGYVWVELWIQLLEDRVQGHTWTFCGNATVLEGEGKVYEAALQRFREHPHHRSLHVSGLFSPTEDRKGFVRIGVNHREHTES